MRLIQECKLAYQINLYRIKEPVNTKIFMYYTPFCMAEKGWGGLSKCDFFTQYFKVNNFSLC